MAGIQPGPAELELIGEPQYKLHPITRSTLTGQLRNIQLRLTATAEADLVLVQRLSHMIQHMELYQLLQEMVIHLLAGTTNQEQ